MAFKTNKLSHTVAVDPAAHFKTLTKRQFPDVMPHQKEMLEEYEAQYQQKGDVALQLPTGSGKTLVGLLIESPRVCRRLHFLRGLSNEQIQKIFPGNPGTCSTHGV